MKTIADVELTARLKRASDLRRELMPEPEMDPDEPTFPWPDLRQARKEIRGILISVLIGAALEAIGIILWLR
jgi:hypothetical protein